MPYLAAEEDVPMMEPQPLDGINVSLRSGIVQWSLSKLQGRAAVSERACLHRGGGGGSAHWGERPPCPVSAL